jgi:hypothetical protein
VNVTVQYAGTTLTEVNDGPQPGLPGVKRGAFVQRAEVCEVVAVSTIAVVLRTRTGVRQRVLVAEAARLGGMRVVDRPVTWPWKEGS